MTNQAIKQLIRVELLNYTMLSDPYTRELIASSILKVLSKNKLIQRSATMPAKKKASAKKKGKK